MRLWLITRENVWEDLRREGSLSFPSFTEFWKRYPSVLEYKEWRHSYEEVARQMATRLPAQDGKIRIPWLAYFRFTKDRYKPDGRSLRYWFNSEHLYSLKLNVPDDEVLLINEDAWMMYINDGAVLWNQDEFNELTRLKAGGDVRALAEYRRKLNERLYAPFPERNPPGADPKWISYDDRPVMAFFHVLRERDVMTVRQYPKPPRAALLSRRAAEHANPSQSRSESDQLDVG